MLADIVRSHVRNGELRLAMVAAVDLLSSATPEEEGELWAVLSRVRARMGMPREALAAAEKAVVTSVHWEAHLALGEARIATGEPYQARDLLAALLEHDLPGTVGEPEEAARRDVRARADRDVSVGVALAEALRATGHPEDGIAVAHRALATAEHVFGKNSLEAAEAWHQVGQCEHAAGHDPRAETSLRRSLQIRKAIAEDHPDIAGTLDAIGVVQRALRRPQEAVKSHREALNRWIAALGPEGGPVGGCRHALAQALHRTGDFAGARDEMALAVGITARAFGGDHVDTHIARFELGRFDVDTGRVEEGFRAMDAARTAVILRLGRDHPVVVAMNRWL